MAIVYRSDKDNIKNKLRGKNHYDNFISDMYDELDKRIGLGEFVIDYIQYGESDEFNESDTVEMSQKSDLRSFIEKITDEDTEKIIAENVEGELYVSVSPGLTYWMKII